MQHLAGTIISQNGLGLAGFTNPGLQLPDEEIFKVLKSALAAGVTLWNGADFYGTPDNNSLHLMNRYFAAYPEDADKVVLCIKSGLKSLGTFSMDCSPAGLRGFVDNALKILGGKKKLDIFGCARVDPAVPVEESIRALAEFKKEGKIGGIQLSEVRAETIRRAAAVEKIDMVEAEISLWATDVFENGVAEVCGELGIVLVAHTPLGGGMLTGQIKSLDDMPAHDYHRHFPRWQPENFAKNRLLVEELENFAKRKGCTTSQLALSWIKSQNQKQGMPYLVPIAGTKSEARLLENIRDLHLTDEDQKELNTVLEKYPVAGARYPPAGAKLAEY
ncbi:putative aldo/keto reductase [Talaromyces proteolyticus]|uniref:Aldo/keto reductase n=1 Tax=Talaromyces proteolyticus TaxID=1131652 RepID=A0AAD4KW59_9EURO|nr:putative aldo/keto reductase [Talaromyces proteolyticus]KAH8702327.1 putative aldo/keto reductase [Talaromyces proteolyticus]